MRYFKFLLLFLLSNGYAQTRDEVIARVVKVYSSAEPLQYSTTYSLFKNHNDKSSIQSYKGFFCKDERSNIYLKIKNTEFLSSSKFNIKINNDDKVIIVTDNRSVVAAQDYDIKKILNSFNAGSFRCKNGGWEIEFVSKPSSAIQYSRVIVNIGKDYFIKKQDFYYNTGFNFSKDPTKREIHYPRLEIAFSQAQRNIMSKEIFKTSNYFTEIGKGLKLTNKYKQYTILYN